MDQQLANSTCVHLVGPHTLQQFALGDEVGGWAVLVIFHVIVMKTIDLACLQNLDRARQQQGGGGGKGALRLQSHRRSYSEPRRTYGTTLRRDHQIFTQCAKHLQLTHIPCPPQVHVLRHGKYGLLFCACCPFPLCAKALAHTHDVHHMHRASTNLRHQHSNNKKIIDNITEYQKPHETAQSHKNAPNERQRKRAQHAHRRTLHGHATKKKR